MPEEEAFAVLVTIMQDFKMRELFKPSMAELGLCMFQLECLLQVSGMSGACLATAFELFTQPTLL